MFYNAFFAACAAFSMSALAHPSHHHDHSKRSSAPTRLVQATDSAFSSARFPDVQAIFEGNLRFQEQRNAAAIQTLVDEGQAPPFMMFSCSDSRVPESTIFDSEPGTFFMSRNIANQYKPGDENAQSAMAYGIRVLGAQHVVVLGHYGCGGIAASIATPPSEGIDVATNIVNTWISDIRQLYLSSGRREIVEMREQNLAIEARGGTVPEPEDVRDPGFRALVEENVKEQVRRISQSSIISNLHDDLAALGAERKRAEGEAALIPVFVHGFVHDIETGEVFDLGISTGPPGFENFVPGATEEATESAGEEVAGGAREEAQSSPILESNIVQSPSRDIIVHGNHFIDARSVSDERLARIRRSPVWSRRRQSS